PLPEGRRVAVLTNSWGPAWLAADALGAAGLDLAEPSDATRAALAEALPEGSRIGPVVDLSNEADPSLFGLALRALFADPGVDAVLTCYAPGLEAQYAEVASAIVGAAAMPGATTLLACLLGAHDPELLRSGAIVVPEFPFPEEAAIALGRVARYAAWRREPLGALPTFPEADPERAAALVGEWLGDSGGCWLDAVRAAELLATFGLAVVDQRLVHDEAEAVAAAAELGYPVALKATGLERLSKTEAGGVSLDVHGQDEVRQAYARMSATLGDAMRPALVQAMVPEGVECRVGLFRHEVLGDVMTLGPGGASAERVDDEALRILPLTDADAARLVDASRVGPLLDEAGVERRASVEDLLLRLGALADCVPEIAQLRLNPVLVSEAGAAITDVRIHLQPWAPDTRPAVRRL
ncbi:MAG TPA: acetate--CoA ligase family protein, partial [Acidimicrobiales bacterium]